MVSGPHRYPVSSMPVSSEYPIQRIMRPVYGATPAGAGAVPVQMSGVPSGNLWDMSTNAAEKKSLLCTHCNKVISFNSRYKHRRRKDHSGVDVRYLSSVIDMDTPPYLPFGTPGQSPNPYSAPYGTPYSSPYEAPHSAPPFNHLPTSLAPYCDGPYSLDSLVTPANLQEMYHRQLQSYQTNLPAGMVPVPQSIQPVASPGHNPPLPSSPQVVNIPDSTQDKEMTTPVKESPVRSPAANSANSSPSADATIKVRLAGSEDFFEVELVDIGDSYNSLVTCFAEELDIKSETVAKIRKLPNILIRKDRDVKRIKHGSEFEVELNPES
ncbi:ankyrin repeat domain-containing protein 40-like [Bolinopsis microptera]|uniref:ankyrin repeat domain-containing protein 40-like n=1 Tax=Bolinopsis microptera TaxID=2820187 RepID=UPI00307A5F0C